MSNTKEWDNLPVGVLTDRAIINCNDVLFGENFNEKSAQQSHYECSIGTNIEWPRRNEDNRKQALKKNEEFLLRPFETVVAITSESFKIPGDCVARFILKGKFFSVGIAPVNTYADAGFDGPMGIVLSNISPRYIKLTQGTNIAKVEFEKLPEQVSQPYKGQHGYNTQHWPVVAEFLATNQDLKQLGIDPLSNSEFSACYGDRIAEIQRKLKYYTVAVWIQLSFLMLFLLIIFFVNDKTNTTTAVIFGVLANIITAAAVTGFYRFMPPKLRDKLGLL